MIRLRVPHAGHQVWHYILPRQELSPAVVDAPPPMFWKKYSGHRNRLMRTPGSTSYYKGNGDGFRRPKVMVSNIEMLHSTKDDQDLFLDTDACEYGSGGMLYHGLTGDFVIP